MAIIGRRGSGKTTLLLDMLRSVYKYKFDLIVFVSPTFLLQDMSKEITSGKGILIFPTFRSEIIDMLCDHQCDRNEGKVRKDWEKALLILDDIGLASRKGQFAEKLDDLAFISRHYSISVIECAQRVTLLSPSMRSQLQCLISFSEANPHERRMLSTNYCTGSKDSWFKTFDDNTAEDHSWIGMSVVAGKYRWFNEKGAL